MNLYFPDFADSANQTDFATVTNITGANFDHFANTDDGSCCGSSLPIPFGTQLGQDIDGEAAGDSSSSGSI